MRAFIRSPNGGTTRFKPFPVAHETLPTPSTLLTRLLIVFGMSLSIYTQTHTHQHTFMHVDKRCAI